MASRQLSRRDQDSRQSQAKHDAGFAIGGAIYAHRKAKIPAHRPGDFSLGRWFAPVAFVAFAYAAAVIVIALAPHEGHTAALYLSGAEAAGVLWYLLYLRPRISRQAAGVLRQEIVEPEAPAEAPSSVS